MRSLCVTAGTSSFRRFWEKSSEICLSLLYKFSPYFDGLPHCCGSLVFDTPSSLLINIIKAAMCLHSKPAPAAH